MRLIKLLDLNIVYLVLVMFILIESIVCIYVYVVMFFVDIIYKYNICRSMYLWGKNICYYIINVEDVVVFFILIKIF